jgi:hypothetical protein
VLVAALAVLGGSSVRGARAAVSSGSGTSARLLATASEADAHVPDELRGVLDRLRQPAAAAVARARTTLDRALALERVVHTGLLAAAPSCYGYATVMTTLGRELGLPVAMTAGSSGFSDYDTHTTVSVWLARYQRWAIVDPTFGGTLTRRGDPRPLGAVDLRNVLRQGWEGEVLWHPSAPDSKPLSQYYVSLVQLFRYVGLYGDVGGSFALLVPQDSRLLSTSVNVVAANALADASPSTPVAEEPAAVTWAAARPRTLSLPPTYAPTEVASRTVSLPATLHLSRRANVVVWTSAPDVKIAGYVSAAVNGGSLSPIFSTDGTIGLVGEGRANVSVFVAKTFPAANER